MKANELRIGNHFKLCGEVYVYTGYVDGSIRCMPYGDTDKTKEIELCESIAEPIPLTEEILLKCGFEAENFPAGKGYYLGDFSIYCYKDTASRFNFTSKIVDVELWVHVKSVHQLQNLYFALIGEELNIEL